MVLLQQRIGKLIDELSCLRYSQTYPIESYRMKKVSGRLSGDVTAGDVVDWQTIGREQIWGGHREFYGFYTEFTVPDEADKRPLVYELRTGREGGWDALNPQFLAYINGEVRQGLDVNHREIRLTDRAKAGETVRIFLSAYTGDYNFSLFLDSEVRILEPEVEHYYYDLKVPFETALLLEPDSREYIDIIQSLNASLNLLDLRKPYSNAFYESLRVAQDNLTHEFYEKKCGQTDGVVACVGHTHIDVAWQWTLATTRDKAVRSFSTVLELMRRYPEYKFLSSQPQLYDFVKKDAPEVYAEIKKRVAEGRWEPEGGMWVEPDCNLTSGESLVRQFIYGLRFFREEFGVENEVLWLPDVFGYSAALPQIMKKCGIHYFMTTKISWNEFNKMPYDTFLWEGLDGTEVLTHFSPSRDYKQPQNSRRNDFFTTYNADLNPSMVKGNWKRYSQKELHTESLMTYGYGDGGGGPTDWMLENSRRMECGIPGCPRTKQEHVLPFFKKLAEDVSGNPYLPRWVGELYLEYHRGTYTTMARNKRYNRKSEFALINLEFYATLAARLFGETYPTALLRESWEVVLRNQFHDIIPGSSIREVYEDSREEYEGMLGRVNAETRRLLQVLTERIRRARAGWGKIVVFNPNSAVSRTVIRIPELEMEGVLQITGDLENKTRSLETVRGTVLFLWDGSQAYELQKTEHGYLAVVDDLPAKGYRVYEVITHGEDVTAVDIQKPSAGGENLQNAGAAGIRVHSNKKNDVCIENSAMTADYAFHVETPFFDVRIDEKGHFVSIYDKRAARELIPAGQCANRMVSYEDKPHNYDAWDINNYYTEKSWEADAVSKMELLEAGPVRACIRVCRPYLDSVIEQYIYFYRDLDRIDIRNEIDWHEKQILLRDYFPVDIHANEAVFEIQYGNVARPTHSNTMWDFAKFEVCAHKWLDVAETGYGVSILNDCKYGCSVKNGVIGLTMLKSPIFPNPEADKEHHTFWYSICPHEGDFRQADTIGKAYLFNNPPVAVRLARRDVLNGGAALAEETMTSEHRKSTKICEALQSGFGGNVWKAVTTDCSNVVIEVIKQAEESANLVLRLYETDNRRSRLAVTVNLPFAEAWETDLLERPLKCLRVCGGQIFTEIKPFEIKTICIR